MTKEEALKQFAMFGNNLIENGALKLTQAQVDAVYAAFRNARDDATTGNTTGSYLQGTQGQTVQYINWGVSAAPQSVVLRKVGETAGGSETYDSLEGVTFSIYRGQKTSIGSSDTAYVSGLTSSANGVFFVGELAQGTYTVLEQSVPSGYAGAGGQRLFYLTVNADGTTSVVAQG